ncbi:hypothetical protein F53441_1703 [Fusarium austroafricanum]|uniref:Zn(2)-C6 fungal-type domain-containing protein n=1 Tax=Fusarium austroafricanum TaxID=2364996 RepID=A0A8H4KVJ9_9HYPO|nr:hypothetical protein F53441_1703 [Fusarium austroafricanum]
MHTHPNQIRSACERCRRQKLRCSRPNNPSSSCARCTRLGLTCQAGLQRRVGRPPKKEILLHKQTENDMQFLQGLLDDTAFNLDPFCGYSPESLPFPMEAWPAVQELDPPEVEQKIICPSGQLFEKLSKLNVDIHRGWEFVADFADEVRFHNFVCTEGHLQTGYQNIQGVLRAMQDYLVVLKALHRQLGTRTVLCQGRTPHTNRIMLSLTADTVSSDSTSPSSSTSGGTTPTSGGSNTPGPPPVFDSATMFLVISCYVQLVKHLEVILRIVSYHIYDPDQELTDAAPMAFADVHLVEPSTQFMLFLEMFSHIMGQTNLLIGLPSPWSSQSAWTGLLTSQRYRSMLNTELGDVENEWTARPSKLMEKGRLTKGILDELSMMGIY